MENFNDSPILIALLQIIALIAQAVLYARGKNAVDLEKRDRGLFSPQVAEALRIAQDALREVDKFDSEKYRALKSIVEQQSQELFQLRAELAAAQESIASLSNKLASRERADRAAEKRAAAVSPLPAGEETQEAGPAGTMDAATLAGLGAIPLRANNAAPADPGRPRSFGRVVAR